MFELARVTTFRQTDTESARRDSYELADPDFDRWPPMGLSAGRRRVRTVLGSPTFAAGAVTVLLGALAATKAHAVLQVDVAHTLLRYFVTLFG